MNTIRTKRFSDFLKRICLNSTISDCVVMTRGKSFIVEAVDATNSLVVVNKDSLLQKEENFEEIGLSNINLLVKFLSTIEDKKISFKKMENRIVFSAKNNKRRLNYLLSNPEMIPNILQKDDEDEDAKETMLSMQQKKIGITKDVLEDFQAYIALSESKDTRIRYEEKKGGFGEVLITIGSNIGHQFQIAITDDNITALKKKKTETINLLINGDFLSKIFSVIDFDSENPPCLYIADKKPIVIEEGKTVWAVAPKVESDSE